MAINSIENAAKYANELDRMFIQKSATGFFTDNALSTKFVGAKTVIIPDVDFNGLADYDRDTGFTRGAITVANTSYTMAMDRARSLQIDREDLTETGVANLAGKILGEYVRTKVVPECDAYVLSKLAGLAMTRSNYYDSTDVDMPIDTLLRLVKEVQMNVGYDEEIVVFVNSYIYAKIMNSADLVRYINVVDFKQGDINLQVKSINGIPLIPVVSDRMKTSYTFNSTGAGGFTPGENAREIYMLACPKNAAHLVKKTENMRIFTPEQNLDADAYKFDYRIYYDVFVKKSGLDSIWAWVSPTMTITSQPESVTVTEGSITETLTVEAESDGSLYYQWYTCENENGSYATKIANARSSAFAIPKDLTAGTYYYFVKIKVDNVADINSQIVTVTVE